MRQHGLRLPDCTSCGRDGRLLTLGDIKAIVQGDRLYRIAERLQDVDCIQCSQRIVRHGLAFSWVNIPPHEASVPAHKRRRRSRRSRQVTP
jgi:hypothetical protein